MKPASLLANIVLWLALIATTACAQSAPPPDSTTIAADAAAARLDPPVTRHYAWYRSDGVKAVGTTVTAWEAATGTPSSRALTQVVGSPRVVRVSTPTGDQNIVRFDGKSALWQATSAWGSLPGERTIVAYLRLAPKANGFLFDGSTNTGMTRAQVRDGKWQAGVQPPPLGNADLADAVTHESKTGEWQVHAWTFKKTAKGTDLSHHQGDDSKSAASQATSPLGGFILGANVATKLGLPCDIAEVIVYDRAADAAELKAVAAYLRKKWGNPADLPAEKQPKAEGLPDDPRLFRTIVRRQGDDGVHTYRIPGLVTTTKGTLVAVFDLRHAGGGDLPGDIDVAISRSTDNGQTWGKSQVILDFDKNEKDARGNGVGDPAILVDRKTGHLIAIALWSYGNRGWNGSGPGLSPRETGQLVITRSTDDGVTWSSPINISDKVKGRDPKWRLFFNGPGSGIQLRDGTLVFAAQFRDGAGVSHSCFIHSGDGGETWAVSAPAIGGKPPTSEAQIAELSDGSLLLSMRNEARTGKRAWSRHTWKGDLSKGQWNEHWLDVTDPTCMASLIRHPTGKLLFSNPNSAKQRVAMTIRVSEDDGRTWTDGRLLDPRGAMYSCMTVLADGNIGILYEGVDEKNVGCLHFARFPLEWVTDAGKEKPGALRLGLPFSDHMVVQRGRPMPVWGQATPGAAVVVTFGGAAGKAIADERGRWHVELPAMPASAEPRELVTQTGEERAVVRDVLVGDVWFAAGQSNMEWPLAKDSDAATQLPKASHDRLRILHLNYAGQGITTKPFSAADSASMTHDRFVKGTWAACSPQSAAGLSAVAYYFAADLLPVIDVPLGIVQLAVGGSPAEAWIPLEALAAHEELAKLAAENWLDNPALEPWCATRARVNLNLRAAAPSAETAASAARQPNHPYRPGFLWAAGVARLLPLPLRGVLWYQGESNAESEWRVQQHAALFPLLVKSWRQAMQDDRLPFLVVQLPGLNRPHWPAFRDQQRRLAASVAHVGLAIAIDTGDANDVHPRGKRVVGQRLSRLAQAMAYQRDVLATGPMAREAQRASGKVTIRFDHAKGLATTDNQAPVGFELAGADGVFAPAEARIVGDEVQLTAAIAAPVKARYGWQPFPQPALTLINRDGLPASPFALDIQD